MSFIQKIKVTVAIQLFLVIAILPVHTSWSAYDKPFMAEIFLCLAPGFMLSCTFFMTVWVFHHMMLLILAICEVGLR